MDHQRTVFLIGAGSVGDDEQAVFTLHVNGAACNLKCSYRDKVIEAEEEDFFEGSVPNPSGTRSRWPATLLLRSKRQCLSGKYRDGEKSRIDSLQGEDGAISARERSGRHI
ncbi:hypothetical protein LB559_22165 [Mesorhizobium sp. BR1-1-3]|uniref:hypothetical protein n=1 Tax=Mesorhizobium sp. BR1-1-3 TaxID=2876651 RepID=UPI001CD162DF|nr:hypothetical protein [Mesorhizobium sp. BR1-1-3]MBZ9890634.1 hypothetical protein [Mesorhizobium sp. BR1-1-3]